MSIYTGQRIPLKVQFTELDENTGLPVIVDITGATIRFDYWYSTTKSNTPPDGTVVGAITGDPTQGNATGSILAVDNTVPGDTMRVQANAIIATDEWPAIAELNIEILERGTIKN